MNIEHESSRASIFEAFNTCLPSSIIRQQLVKLYHPQAVSHPQ
jgi:hypothetical protein